MQTPIYLVTGATDGIGRATALALARRGAVVILHGRNPDKLAAVHADLLAATGNRDLHPVLADFASLDQVAALAARLARDFAGLAVLVNNAGLLTDHRQLSRDGFELTLAVNYLAPCLLTLRLLDTLRANRPARIVHVSSSALGGGRVDLADLGLERGFDGWQAYANSKLLNACFSQHLAGQLAGTGVVSNALCPGLIDTNFFHTNRVFADGAYERLRPRMRPADEGALMPLVLATDPGLGGRTGGFYVRAGRDGWRPVPLALDAGDVGRLWEHTLGLLAPWLGP